MRRCQRYWVLSWSAYDCHACAQCTWQLHYRTELELARRMPSQQRGRCAAWYQDKRKARTGDSTWRRRGGCERVLLSFLTGEASQLSYMLAPQLQLVMMLQPCPAWLGLGLGLGTDIIVGWMSLSKCAHHGTVRECSAALRLPHPPAGTRLLG